jgi:dolichol-phosphate mannosyltransferase
MIKEDVYLSIVIPVYMGEGMVKELIDRIENNIRPITSNYEIILVNDCSPDNSWLKIKELAITNEKIKGFNLSRNFGQHQAIYAGLFQSKGKWIVVMDCDLQDRPEEISNFYNKTQEGYDIILASRLDRNDGFFKKTFSKYFYLFLSYLTESKQDYTVANFGMYSRNVIDAILSMNDYYKYFPTMVHWVGFKKATVAVEHSERASGVSSYNFYKLIKLAINVIITFSDKPLRLIIKLGALISLISLSFSIYFGILYLKGQIMVAGYTSLIISIWFLSGVIISVLGMVGLYVGRVFDQVKDRPKFIISEKVN